MFEKVKECVEHYKSQGNFTYDQQKFLSALATEYLQVSGRMPEEKKCTLVGEGEQCGDDLHQTAIINYNQARHSCILAIMGAVPSENDIYWQLVKELPMDKYLGISSGHLKQIATALHTLLTNKLGGKG